MKLGVHNLTFTEYRAIAAVNWHLLEPYRMSAKHARHAELFPPDAVEAQKLGEAFHSAVLEPERFAREYVTMPRFDGHPNSNAHKSAKAEWIEANKNLVSLSADEYESLKAMAQAAREHPDAAALLNGKGRNELSIVWTVSETTCKGRIDRLCYAPKGVLYPTCADPATSILCLLDVKTTRKIKPGMFDADLAHYGYHGQLAFYHDGLQALAPAPMAVAILAIENEPPFDVAIYRLDDDTLDAGRKLYKELLAIHIACAAAKSWPGVAPSAVPVVLPRWAQNKEE